MSTLIIVESPTKAKKLPDYLPAGYKVMASGGHIRDLDDKAAAGDIVNGVNADLSPRYTATERGAETISRLKKAVETAQNVILATDPDREGEAIAWHLAQALKLKNADRITFNEITKTALEKALNSVRKININQVGAQETRRVLDRLVGFRVSPGLCNLLNTRASAGRVQTPALRLVVDREREITAFVPTAHFSAGLNMGGWGLELDTKQHADESGYMLDRSIAERAAAVKAVTVTKFEEGVSNQNPPAAFTTSTMQQAASVKLKFNPKKTMDIAQKLFENGAITYHRTDSPNLSADAFTAICDISNALNLPVVEKQRTFKAKGDAQEAHEAIRPTDFAVESPAGLDADQVALYQLIRTRALASQLQAASYATRKVIAEADSFTFTATGKTLISAGFKVLLENDDTDESAKQRDNPVPKLAEGDVLQVVSSKLLEKSTKAPQRYTQAALVKKLEDAGVGRPATYAPILENITNRGYVLIDEKTQQLTPTQLGYSVIDALVNRFAFAEISYTRELEERLDKIEHGNDTYKAVVADLNDRLSAELANLPAGEAVETQACPKCASKMYKRARKKDGKPFWGCSNRECGHIENITVTF